MLYSDNVVQGDFMYIAFAAGNILVIKRNEVFLSPMYMYVTKSRMGLSIVMSRLRSALTRCTGTSFGIVQRK